MRWGVGGSGAVPRPGSRTRKEAVDPHLRRPYGDVGDHEAVSATSTVTWRKAVASVAATAAALLAVVVVVRAEGLDATDASASRAVGWFAHQPSGRVVLVDGYGGRALAVLDAEGTADSFEVVDGRAGAFLVDRATAEVRTVDAVELRLGPPQGVAALGARAPITGVSQTGLVVVDPDEQAATLLPPDGDAVSFDVGRGSEAMVAPDGAIWSREGGEIVRATSAGEVSPFVALPGEADLTLVGARALVLDRDGRRVRLGGGGWHDLPTAVDPSELVLQEPGPAADCGWVGADDQLWCVAEGGIERRPVVAGLDIDGSDRLAIAGSAGALVRRGPTAVARFDWRTGELLDDRSVSVRSDATLDVQATVDLIWVDDRAGDFVWAITPWAINEIDKADADVLVVGADGVVVDGHTEGPPDADRSVDAEFEEQRREPDDNGIDDAPVAVDDPVTARAGGVVTIPVTANDYDPDGEAVVLVDVGVPGHGTVEIGTASTVVYNAEPGYVGPDRFEYTIADGNGTTASAVVAVELLPPDGTNRPPVGAGDVVQTGPGVAVEVEVLLNDVDPERDPLEIGSFTPPEGLGQLTETVGPSGLPALRFQPTAGFEGTARFAYRPEDVFGALGEEVEVRVEVARDGDDNRPPEVAPDSVRLRRNLETSLPVLVNDRDPDGDRLALSVVEPLPDGLDVTVRGEELVVIARAGAAALVPFEYEVDDGHGHLVRGAALAHVLDDVEPNRPPVVAPDSATAVVGDTVVIDVTANDSDPDGDPLVVVDATQPDGRGEVIVLDRSRLQFTPGPLGDDDRARARFTYTVDDGHGHRVAGDVVVTVVPEPLPEPPYARDDSASTYVDVPVTVDVLRNDGDPSGERPQLVGTPGCAGGGRAVVTVDEQVRFDPPPGRTGAFRCTYEVTNSQQLRASASIVVSVRQPAVVNEAPVTTNDTLTVEVGETQGVDVTANDRDPDGDDAALELVSSTAPTLGSARRSGNRIIFAADDRTGVATITYQVADADGAVSTGRLLVRVTERQPVPPVATDDRRTIIGPGGPVSFDVLANDVDPDESAGGLQVTSVELTSGAGAVALSGRVVTITPDPDTVGDVVATYRVTDGDGLSDSARVVLTVLEPLNRPPVANDDVAEVANGGSVTTNVLFNDSDPDGDELTATILSGPDPGLGSISTSGGSVTFTADPGASGTAVVRYQVSDGELVDDASLRISVRGCDESFPVADDAFLATGHQQPVRVELGRFAANGTVTDVVAPAGFADGVYTPPAGENGNVVITYAVVNGCRQRATGTVTIDVNQDPVSRPLTLELARTDVREVAVTDLASDREPLRIAEIRGAPPWVSVNDSGTVALFAPAGAATGDYAMTAVVSDPGGLTASVALTVVVGNRPPVALDDRVDLGGARSVTIDVLANDRDPDGEADALRIQAVPGSIEFSEGGTATVAIVADGRRLRIDLADGRGTAVFQYTAVDGDGSVSAAATVTLTASAPPTTSVPPTTVPPTAPSSTGVPTTTVEPPPTTTPATASSTTTTSTTTTSTTTTIAPATRLTTTVP